MRIFTRFAEVCTAGGGRGDALFPWVVPGVFFFFQLVREQTNTGGLQNRKTVVGLSPCRVWARSPPATARNHGGGSHRARLRHVNQRQRRMSHQRRVLELNTVLSQKRRMPMPQNSTSAARSRQHSRSPRQRASLAVAHKHLPAWRARLGAPRQADRQAVTVPTAACTIHQPASQSRERQRVRRLLPVLSCLPVPPPPCLPLTAKHAPAKDCLRLHDSAIALNSS